MTSFPRAGSAPFQLPQARFEFDVAPDILVADTAARIDGLLRAKLNVQAAR